MQDYNFWRDFFDTYQSLSDGMKFAWLAMPALFALGLTALASHYRLARRRMDNAHTDTPANALDGELLYSIHRDDLRRLHIHRHATQGDPALEHHPTILLLEDQVDDQLNKNEIRHE